MLGLPRLTRGSAGEAVFSHGHEHDLTISFESVRRVLERTYILILLHCRFQGVLQRGSAALSPSQGLVLIHGRVF